MHISKNGENMMFNDPQFRNWIISHLRRLTFRWQPKNNVKKLAKRKVGEFKTGKEKFGYLCASCQKVYQAKDVQVDHIDPVIDPLHGFMTYDILIERMFCPESKLQVLCKNCHDKKSAHEKTVASERRKQVKVVGTKKKGKGGCK